MEKIEIPLIRDHMTTLVHVLNPKMKIKIAVEMMKEYNVRHFPVFDDGKLTGLLECR